jgi:hypothetical protein
VVAVDFISEVFFLWVEVVAPSDEEVDFDSALAVSCLDDGAELEDEELLELEGPAVDELD